MLDGLIALGRGVHGLLDPWSLLYVAAATLAGLVVGALPGFTATTGVALLTALTIRMPAETTVLILVGVYVGAIYGGSWRAILLNLPGLPADAARRDGHALARSGLAGRALGISTTGSVMGTLIGMVFLAALTPVLGTLALRLDVFELAWLAVFAVVVSGSLSGDDALKGWLAAGLGLAAASVGPDPIQGHARFGLGHRDLAGGFALIPALVGAVGVAEVLSVLGQRGSRPAVHGYHSYLPRPGDVFRYWRTIVRSGLIGTAVGIVPGVGEDVASRAAYAAARRASREPERFGQGSMEGLMAAETGENAGVPGAMIPALALAVPGSAPAAVLMAALLIHGVRPGPLVMVTTPQLVYDVVAATLFAALAILAYGLVMARPLIRVLRVPREPIMPVAFILCTVGSYAIAGRRFDIWTMLGFGIVGAVLRWLDYPLVPLVVGIVLGGLLDRNLRQGLVLAEGSPWPFVTRPISAVLCAAVVLTILASVPAVRAGLARWLGRGAPGRA